jgi:hypothetical protein
LSLNARISSASIDRLENFQLDRALAEVLMSGLPIDKISSIQQSQTTKARNAKTIEKTMTAPTADGVAVKTQRVIFASGSMVV